ncbi:MAG: DUF2892 domain-containing protein [Anaerolineales bacterium]|jgi:hypothetical protein
MGFAKFMSSGMGRALRIVAGLALIVVGALFANGTLGIILIIVGIIPLVAGLLDMCFIGALLLGTPLKGDDVRADITE